MPPRSVVLHMPIYVRQTLSPTISHAAAAAATTTCPPRLTRQWQPSPQARRDRVAALCTQPGRGSTCWGRGHNVADVPSALPLDSPGPPVRGQRALVISWPRWPRRRFRELRSCWARRPGSLYAVEGCLFWRDKLLTGSEKGWEVQEKGKTQPKQAGCFPDTRGLLIEIRYYPSGNFFFFLFFPSFCLRKGVRVHSETAQPHHRCLDSVRLPSTSS